MTPYALPHYLAASARAHPGRPAAVDGDRHLTYAELEARANRVAHLLIELGVSRGDRVGVYLDKSVESIVAVHGALKAGAAYVPLDPRAPVRRLAYIAGDCGMRVLLSGREKAAAWGGLSGAGGPVESVVAQNADHDVEGPPGVRVVTAAALGQRPDVPPPVEVIDQDLAYILYTSGSTGEPKGVMLSHRNALTFVDWTVDLLGVGPDDRLSNHAPLHFDLSVFDLFGAAAAGASVTVVPQRASMLPVELARFMDRHRITVWYSVPSILSMLALRGGLRGGDLPALRAVVFAGEVFPTKYLRRLMELLPHAEFHNWYGPTETNVCTWYRVDPVPRGDDPIPIGRAIANMEVFAVTEDGRRAAPGEVGELYVRGSGVMRGYWGDPERTARMLVANPFGGSPDPAYRTGDLVRQDPDGHYRYLGRRDAQIKSRGYRIELGDIEAALLAHPSVLQCAVTAVPDELVTNRIRAHVVVQGDVGQGDLVRFCRERIPPYMVPEEFRFLDDLPRTSTGKTDRRALSASG